MPSKRLVPAGLLAAALLGPPGAPAADPQPPRMRFEPPPIEVGWNDAAVLGFDMASSCLISGIGAATKKKNFLEGCLKGALLGAPLMYVGQKTAAYTGYYPGLGYPATLAHSLGVSMRDNAADGIGLFDRYQVNWGPVQMSFAGEEHGGTKGYFLPGPMAGMIYGFSVGTMDLETSFKTGVPVFRGDISLAERLNRGSLKGVTLPNVIVMGEDSPTTFGHEFIHTLQFREMSFLDLVFDNYAWGKTLDRNYVKVGQDAGMFALQPPNLLLPHDSRPVEWVPNALQLRRPQSQ